MAAEHCSTSAWARHVWKNLGVGIAYSTITNKNDATVSVRVPHPVIFGQSRTATATAPDLEHSENVVHLQFMWTIPLTSKFELAVMAGRRSSPCEQTVATVQAPQDITDPPPLTTVTINSVTLTDVKDSPVGVNIGVDGTYWIRDRSTASASASADSLRYAGASLDLDGPPGMTRDTELKAGGPQGGAGPAPSVLDELMRILMIAPEPFFEPRGTPFSEYHRIRALLDLGHTVDLVTYPFGKDVTLPGLRIFRAARPPFITRVKIGPSPAKLFLDMTLTLTALNRARKGQYDAVHSHEEGAAIGVVISAALGIPHLYDMHSSLPQQLENFAFSRSAVLRWMFQLLERTAIKRSRVTIVICPHLEETARKVVPDARVVLIENAPGSGDMPVAGSGKAVRASLGIDATAPMVLYTGTFEAYQGLDLLFAAAKAVRAERPDARFVLAGGKPDQVARAKAQAAASWRRRAHLHRRAAVGSDSRVSRRGRCAGVAAQLRHEHAAEDLSISAFGPRHRRHAAADAHAGAVRRGRDSDRADRRTSFARGILQAIDDPAAAARIGDAAKHLAETRYTYEAYLQRTREACAALVA